MAKTKIQNLEKQIYDFAKKTLGGDKQTAHSFDHVERVYRLAVRIAKTEPTADMEIVKAAALLHDIKREQEDFENGNCHAKEGAKFARVYLKEIGFPEEKIDKACGAILKHRKSGELKPETLEEKIIKDADKLDLIGAVCIARVFTEGAHRNYPLYDPSKPAPKKWEGAKKLNCTLSGFNVMSLLNSPNTFYMQEAKRIAKERYNFTKDFYNRFIKEWNGEA